MDADLNVAAGLGEVLVESEEREGFRKGLWGGGDRDRGRQVGEGFGNKGKFWGKR